MDRYIGLDAHASSCTVVTVGPSGRRVHSQVVETNAAALIRVLRGIPGTRHLCLEEGTHASWLCEVLSPHVEELVVAGVSESRGPKSDKLDAFGLAEQLRIGAVKRKVYKQRGEFGALRHRAKAYTLLVSDSVRVQNRIKSLFRSRGVAIAGKSVFLAGEREAWLRKLSATARSLAELLMQEQDGLLELRKKAEKEMLAEAGKHRAWRLVRSCPGLGEIRTAQLLPIVVTPYRFKNKRSFWAYCGLGIVMRSSSDWVRTQSGEWVKASIQQTRGLNRNANRTLKGIFRVPGPPGQDPPSAPHPPSPLPRRLCSQRSAEVTGHGPGPGGQRPRHSGPRSRSSPPSNALGFASQVRGTSTPTTQHRPLAPIQVGHSPRPHR